MSNKQTFIVVGGGLAGAKAVETLRTEGFDGDIILFTEEAVRPYQRPPLSKDYLRREAGFDQCAVHDENFYTANNIELHTSSRVVEINPATSKVTLASGEVFCYTKLLLATGSVPRRLMIPGAELNGVNYLRDISDADNLTDVVTATAGAKRRVVIVGSGWIGSEVAASIREMGAEVSVVELASVPLERVLGTEVGSFYRDLHIEHGVDMHFGVGIEAIRGATSVEEVVLSDGTVLDCAVVVVGIGVFPRTELAEAVGLSVNNGIVTDEYLKTSERNIYAAGDVATVFYPFYQTHIHLEHWSAAINQGPIAARNMLGISDIYEQIPYFYSDQYDVGMEYTGFAPTWDQILFRGNPATKQFITFWLDKTGRVLAGMNVNVWEVAPAIEALIRSCKPVDLEQLVNPNVDLASLV
jgi:3-phenylpropionate/trans-cinnamate dioxygenase ferredoxin reductase subunit